MDSKDPIGTILVSFGLSDVNLKTALKHQRTEARLPLGEICVRQGYVPGWVRDAAVARQKASQRGVAAMMRLAQERTRMATAAIRGGTE
jgi:hypothetical protein